MRILGSVAKHLTSAIIQIALAGLILSAVIIHTGYDDRLAEAVDAFEQVAEAFQ